jgi:hypothetical protein
LASRLQVESARARGGLSLWHFRQAGSCPLRGSHGAFTWGVLDRLLEEERLSLRHHGDECRCSKCGRAGRRCGRRGGARELRTPCGDNPPPSGSAFFGVVLLPLVTHPSSCIRSLTWMLSSERTTSLISRLTLSSARPATSRSNFSTESSHVNGSEGMPGKS